MIRTQLETARLILYLFTYDEIQIMFELNSDPKIINHDSLLAIRRRPQCQEKGARTDAC